MWVLFETAAGHQEAFALVRARVFDSDPQPTVRLDGVKVTYWFKFDSIEMRDSFFDTVVGHLKAGASCFDVAEAADQTWSAVWDENALDTVAVVPEDLLFPVEVHTPDRPINVRIDSD